jgi:microcystin-dependent protein
MSSPFVAEIKCVAFNFAQTGWALCDGQILPISQNTALFSLLGTYYGGDGKSTFALPNLQANAVVGQGQSTTGQFYDLGEVAGVPSVSLISSEMPLHTHTMQAVPDPADQTTPQPDRSAARSKPGNAFQSTVNASLVNMAPQTIAVSGGSLPHNNMQPYLTMNFVIALQGVFPPRG